MGGGHSSCYRNATKPLSPKYSPANAVDTCTTSITVPHSPSSASALTSSALYSALPSSESTVYIEMTTTTGLSPATQQQQQGNNTVIVSQRSPSISVATTTLTWLTCLRDVTTVAESSSPERPGYSGHDVIHVTTNNRRSDISQAREIQMEEEVEEEKREQVVCTDSDFIVSPSRVLSPVTWSSSSLSFQKKRSGKRLHILSKVEQEEMFQDLVTQLFAIVPSGSVNTFSILIMPFLQQLQASFDLQNLSDSNNINNDKNADGSIDDNFSDNRMNNSNDRDNMTNNNQNNSDNGNNGNPSRHRNHTQHNGSTFWLMRLFCEVRWYRFRDLPLLPYPPHHCEDGLYSPVNTVSSPTSAAMIENSNTNSNSNNTNSNNTNSNSASNSANNTEASNIINTGSSSNNVSLWKMVATDMTLLQISGIYGHSDLICWCVMLLQQTHAFESGIDSNSSMHRSDCCHSTSSNASAHSSDEKRTMDKNYNKNNGATDTIDKKDNKDTLFAELLRVLVTPDPVFGMTMFHMMLLARQDQAMMTIVHFLRSTFPHYWTCSDYCDTYNSNNDIAAAATDTYYSPSTKSNKSANYSDMDSNCHRNSSSEGYHYSEVKQEDHYNSGSYTSSSKGNSIENSDYNSYSHSNKNSSKGEHKRVLKSLLFHICSATTTAGKTLFHVAIEEQQPEVFVTLTHAFFQPATTSTTYKTNTNTDNTDNTYNNANSNTHSADCTRKNTTHSNDKNNDDGHYLLWNSGNNNNEGGIICNQLLSIWCKQDGRFEYSILHAAVAASAQAMDLLPTILFALQQLLRTIVHCEMSHHIHHDPTLNTDTNVPNGNNYTNKTTLMDIVTFLELENAQSETAVEMLQAQLLNSYTNSRKVSDQQQDSYDLSNIKHYVTEEETFSKHNTKISHHQSSDNDIATDSMSSTKKHTHFEYDNTPDTNMQQHQHEEQLTQMIEKNLTLLTSFTSSLWSLLSTPSATYAHQNGNNNADDHHDTMEEKEEEEEEENVSLLSLGSHTSASSSTSPRNDNNNNTSNNTNNNTDIGRTSNNSAHSHFSSLARFLAPIRVNKSSIGDMNHSDNNNNCDNYSSSNNNMHDFDLSLSPPAVSAALLSTSLSSSSFSSTSTPLTFLSTLMMRRNHNSSNSVSNNNTSVQNHTTANTTTNFSSHNNVDLSHAADLPSFDTDGDSLLLIVGTGHEEEEEDAAEFSE